MPNRIITAYWVAAVLNGSSFAIFYTWAARSPSSTFEGMFPALLAGGNVLVAALLTGCGLLLLLREAWRREWRLGTALCTVLAALPVVGFLDRLPKVISG